jgi:two-component system chemotaxis response regulator CheB
VTEPAQRLVVVGGSAGGLEALTRVVAQLPGDLPAAVLAVIHFPTTGISRLADILARRSALRVRLARQDEPIEAGHVYVPPPNRHLLAGRGVIRLSAAPRENGHRPAIDPLFRSAARHYGAAATGVILCGNLDDGSAGLVAIRRAGGVGVVVDPDSCAFADMPRNAIMVGEPDHVTALDAMGGLIDRLVRRPLAVPAGPGVVRAVDEEERMADDEDTVWGDDRPGRPSGYTCPECHGVLWEIDQPGMPRFACRIGHRLSAESLVESRDEEIEGALWAAVRSLEEQASLARRLCDRAAELGHGHTEERFRHRAEEAKRQAEVLRNVALRPLEPPASEAGG